MPTDGTRAANVGTGDFGTSPIFVQLSDKPLLVGILLVGVSERKAQWRTEKLCADPIRVARSGEAGLNKYCPNPCIDPIRMFCAHAGRVVRTARVLGMDRQQ